MLFYCLIWVYEILIAYFFFVERTDIPGLLPTGLFIFEKENLFGDGSNEEKAKWSVFFFQIYCRWSSFSLFHNMSNVSLHKKWNFPLRISLVNVTKSEVSYGFDEEILNGKLHFCVVFLTLWVFLNFDFNQFHNNQSMYVFGPNDTNMADCDRFDRSKRKCFLNNLIRAPVGGLSPKLSFEASSLSQILPVFCWFWVLDV